MDKVGKCQASGFQSIRRASWQDEDRKIGAAGCGLPLYLRDQGFRRPVPVFNEGKLCGHDGRSGNTQMRIPPVVEFGSPVQVFIANVMAADPAMLTICDNELAVVAKIDLEMVAGSACRIKGGNMHAGLAQFRKPCICQFNESQFHHTGNRCGHRRWPCDRAVL